jgi:2-isopropylmalate synthase
MDPRLISFSIGSITGGTDALGECTVRLEYEGHEVLGQGAHSDIIVASAKAYINAINRALNASERSSKVQI